MIVTVADYFRELPYKINPEILAYKADTTFHFKFTGTDAVYYTVKIENGNMSVSNALVGEANCVITTTSQEFIDIITQKTNSPKSITLGKLKVSNIATFVTFTKVFGW